MLFLYVRTINKKNLFILRLCVHPHNLAEVAEVEALENVEKDLKETEV